MRATSNVTGKSADGAAQNVIAGNGGDYETITDRELRVLGEAAAGCSGPQFVAREGNKFHLRPDENGPGRVVFAVRPERVSAMPGAPDTILVKKGSRELEVRRKYDALFWSASACEKFVLSYYYSLRLLTSDQMAELLDGIYSPNTVAIAHEFKSPNEVITSGDLVDSLRFLDARLVDKEDQEDAWVPLHVILH